MVSSPNPWLINCTGAGGVEVGRGQPEQPQKRHPGPAVIHQDQTAGHPQAQAGIGQVPDGFGAELPVLDDPAAAAKRGGEAVEGVAPKRVVIIVDEVAPGMQPDNPQRREEKIEKPFPGALPGNQSPGQGHRHQRPGEKGQPRRPDKHSNPHVSPP